MSSYTNLVELAGFEPASKISLTRGATCLVCLYSRTRHCEQTRYANTYQNSISRFTSLVKGSLAISFGFEPLLIPVLQAEARAGALSAEY